MSPEIFGKFLSRFSFIQELAALDEYLRQANKMKSLAQTFRENDFTRVLFVDKHREAIDTFNHNKFFWMRKRNYEV